MNYRTGQVSVHSAHLHNILYVASRKALCLLQQPSLSLSLHSGSIHKGVGQ